MSGSDAAWSDERGAFCIDAPGKTVVACNGGERREGKRGGTRSKREHTSSREEAEARVCSELLLASCGTTQATVQESKGFRPYFL